MSLRTTARRIGALVALSSLLTACGGVPSRADFIAKTKDTVGSDLTVALEARGVSKSDAEAAIDRFIGCQYDALKSDVDLLQKAYDDPGDTTIQPDLDAKAGPCTTDFIAQVGEVADPTTTTEPIGLPTSVPEVTVETIPADTVDPADDTSVETIDGTIVETIPAPTTTAG